MSPRADAISAVIFDLYGTLIDIWTDEGDLHAYETVSGFLEYLGVRLAPEDLRAEYGHRVEAALRQSPEPHPEVDVFWVFHDLLRQHGRAVPSAGPGGSGRWRPNRAVLALATAVLFRSATRRVFRLFPGVLETLSALRARYRLGLVTDAQWVFTEPELHQAGLLPYFPVRILSSRLGIKKPDPRLFAEAVRQLEVDPGESVYVGDSPERDLVGARRAGLRCVLFRGRSQGAEAQPDAWFSAHEELPGLIDRLGGVLA